MKIRSEALYFLILSQVNVGFQIQFSYSNLNIDDTDTAKTHAKCSRSYSTQF